MSVFLEFSLKATIAVIFLSVFPSQYLGPTDKLCLKVDPQTKDESPAYHCHPGHQPQALGQTHPPLLGELHLQQLHGSLQYTGRHKDGREK